MDFNLHPESVRGLEQADRETLSRLLNIYRAHQSANRLKEKYYNGHITLGEVNLGIALPHGMARLSVGCDWGKKAVDVLAARSMFDGFVDNRGGDAGEIKRIADANRLIAQYKTACRDELKLGATFATLSKDPNIGCKIRFHSERTAAAEWDGNKDRIRDGFAIIDYRTERDGLGNNIDKASLVYLYTDENVVALRRTPADNWEAVYFPHKLGRPLMEPLIYDATSDKPFGRSRIKKTVRALIQGHVRTVANATIGLEF